MEGEAGSSEPDDSVSEHEELVSMFSTTKSSGAGLLLFLVEKVQRKDLTNKVETRKNTQPKVG